MSISHDAPPGLVVTVVLDSVRVALVEAGSPGLNIYSHVAMGRGVPLLATVVRDAGYETRAFVEDVSGKGSIDWDWVAEASVVGFSAITCTMPRTAEIIREVRALNPSARIVLGGPEPTCDPNRSFAIDADFVLRGEAEHSFPELLAVLSDPTDASLESVPGLVWRRDGAIRRGVPPQQLSASELDALPAVDRSLVHLADRTSVASVWRTRGCPDACDFCEVRILYPRCVKRSDDRTLEELMRAQSDGYATTFLIDDNAAANKPAFKEFLRGVVDHGYSRMLVAQMRADAAFRSDGRLDRELLRLLKKAASVTIVCVGVESASDEDLESVNKRIDAKRMARALKAMRRYGLLVHGMFIALSNDTRQAIKHNGDYARRYVTSLQYLFETPLPGTKRTAEHETAGRVMFSSAEDLRFFDGMHVVLRPDEMPAEEMQGLVVREYRRFYSTRRVVLSALSGTFLRFRRLTRQQRAYLRGFEGPHRLRRWLRLHVEYKFAPVAFLATGRQRLRTMVRDPEYVEYLERVRSV